jgi:tetratricopeptide (TPR) repeat protein
MSRTALSIALVFALSAAAAAQDIVRLRNGRFVSGTFSVTDSDKDGFKVQLWDSGATVFIRWNQIPDAERLRLLNRSAESGGPTVEMIDGVQALTENREVIGVLVKEDANQLLIKTRDSKSPTPVPKSALLKPQESRKIRESDAYSPEEMVDIRAAKAGDGDYAALLSVGRFAAALKLYERAKDFYKKAFEADASKKDEIEPIIAQNEILIKEGKASAMLAEVKDLMENTEYAKAIDLAKKLLADYADTETAKQNKDLVDRIEREAKDFEVKKADLLAQKVPEMYKAKRQSYFSQASSSKNTLSQARTAVGKIDDDVTKELAKMLKSTPEEIKAAWDKRDSSKMRQATYGAGSWIVNGGQDGNLDTDQKYTPDQTQNKNQNGGNGFMDQFGNRGKNNRGGNQPQKPTDLGKPLQKSQEWWANASSTDRKNWVEAEYAHTSSSVKKEEKTKKCTTCQGEGMLKATRGPGVQVEIKCPRCHGCKEDLLINYG